MKRKGNFEDLIVWQKAIKLSSKLYKITKNFPKEELYGLTSQIRRCSVSIASNIAEGAERNSKKEFIRFLSIAKGSCAELKTQLYIALESEMVDKSDFESIYGDVEEVSIFLSKLEQSIKKQLANLTT